MVQEKNIRLIRHPDINAEKWNRCIDQAPNCRIYAYDWYLDRTAVYWDALVYGNYEYVMPLPVRNKWFIKYLYNPYFSQQLGIFPAPPENISESFYREMVFNYRYGVIHLNAGNLSVNFPSVINVLERKNYLLALQPGYNILSGSFSKNCQRNIMKSEKSDLYLIKGIGLEEYMNFKNNNLAVPLKKDQFNSLRSIIAFGQYKEFVEIYGVYSPENELCAAVCFCHWNNRIIYLNAASNDQGKLLGGMYFLINETIKEYAGHNVFLDFEGSVVPGLQRFYSGFGAIPETYFQLNFNRLPLPFRWIKKG